jgi:hypothetical protein
MERQMCTFFRSGEKKRLEPVIPWDAVPRIGEIVLMEGQPMPLRVIMVVHDARLGDGAVISVSVEDVEWHEVQQFNVIGSVQKS